MCLCAYKCTCICRACSHGGRKMTVSVVHQTLLSLKWCLAGLAFIEWLRQIGQQASEICCLSQGWDYKHIAHATPSSSNSGTCKPSAPPTKLCPRLLYYFLNTCPVEVGEDDMRVTEMRFSLAFVHMSSIIFSLCSEQPAPVSGSGEQGSSGILRCLEKVVYAGSVCMSTTH